MASMWQRFKVWLRLSEPGERKEQLEDLIEAHDHDIEKLYESQETDFASFGYYRQHGSLKFPWLPKWASARVGVYEAPKKDRSGTEHGYLVLFSVDELDGSRWQLTVDPDDGAQGWVTIGKGGL